MKKSILNRVKARAKARSIPFDLTINDFELPRTCPILGVPLSLGDKQGGSAYSPSLDRIVPELGYIRGNVQVISKRANSIKSDANAEEIRMVLEWVTKASLHQ